VADGDAQTITVEQVQSLLGIFGRIASAREVLLPDGAGQFVAHVFEFCNATHAQVAVDAIGDRPGTGFSLHLFEGSGMAMPGRDGGVVQMRVATEGTSDRSESDGGEYVHAGQRHNHFSDALGMAMPMVHLQRPYLQLGSPPDRSFPLSSPSCRSMETADWSIPLSAPPCMWQNTNNQTTAHGGPFMAPRFSPQSFIPSHNSTDSTVQSSAPLPAGLSSDISMPMAAGALPAMTAWPGPMTTATYDAAHSMHVNPSTPSHKTKRRMDLVTAFDVNEAATGGPRARTTVMVRNIPCRWSADDFLSVLQPVIGQEWDLLYMPCKTSEVANSGYAFLNFKTSQSTLHLYNAMHGRHWPNTRSGKVCEIRYARIQGRQLLSHLGSNDKGAATAFRGHLAYPSAGQIIVHGPDTMRRPPAAADVFGSMPLTSWPGTGSSGPLTAWPAHSAAMQHRGGPFGLGRQHHRSGLPQFCGQEVNMQQVSSHTEPPYSSMFSGHAMQQYASGFDGDGSNVGAAADVGGGGGIGQCAPLMGIHGGIGGLGIHGGCRRAFTEDGSEHGPGSRLRPPVTLPACLPAVRACRCCHA
jgi:hypothetical protein